MNEPDNFEWNLRVIGEAALECFVIVVFALIIIAFGQT